MSATAEITGLPERITCDQDIEDAYGRFMAAADEFCTKRIARDDMRSEYLIGRKVVFHGDMHWITDSDVEELAKLTGEDQRGHIPWRSAMNFLSNLIQEINWIREAVGLEPMRGKAQKRDEMAFYYIHGRVEERVTAARVLVQAFIDWQATHTTTPATQESK